MVAVALCIAALLRSGDACFGAAWDDSLRRFGNFERARAIAVDPAGDVYVLDAGISTVLRFSHAGEQLDHIGGYGWDDLAFQDPYDLSAPNHLDVYVADYGNHRIQRLDRRLNYVSSLSLRDRDDPQQTFGYPKSVAVSRLGSLFILDGENIRIVKVTNDRTVERTFGGVEAGRGRLVSPVRLRTDERDRVIVQDHQRLVMFDDFGNFLATIPWPDLIGFAAEGGNFFMLDSSTITRLPPSGAPDTVVVPGGVAGATRNDTIVDIAVRGGTLYLLRRHYVLVMPIGDKREER